MRSVLLLACSLVACGDAVGTPITPGGDDASIGSPGSDSGATTDGGSAGDAAIPPSDGGTGADAAISETTAALTIGTFGQNCQPALPPDPSSIDATWSLTNTGKSNVGPVTISSATLLTANTLAPVATFTANGTLPTIAPQATNQTLVTKTDGSLTPKNGGAGGCDTLQCNQAYVLELAYTGPGIAAGATVRSPPKTLGCVF